MKNIANYFLALSFFILPFALYAESKLSQKLSHILDTMGMDHNMSDPEFVKGELSDHLIGGSIDIRNPVLSKKLIHISTPRLNAGCGGIDLHFGGVSFIKRKDLERGMKYFAQNAASYAVILGMKTFSPQMASTLESMQDWANWANQVSMNSCESAEQFVDLAWPKYDSASQYLCQKYSNKSGKTSDWIKSRQKCSSFEGDIQTETKKAYKDLILDDFNVGWAAIKNMELSAFSNSNQAKELLMSLTGTLVAKRGEEEEQSDNISSYPSMVFDSNLLHALLNGGDAQYYSCDDTEKCLAPKRQNIFIAEGESWVPRIEKALHQAKEAIENEGPMPSDLALLGSHKGNVLKLLNLVSLSGYAGGDHHTKRYASYLATRSFCDLVTKVLGRAMEMTRAVKQNQPNKELFDEFLTSLEKVFDQVAQMGLKAEDSLQDEYNTAKFIQLLEGQLWEKVQFQFEE